VVKTQATNEKLSKSGAPSSDKTPLTYFHMGRTRGLGNGSSGVEEAVIELAERLRDVDAQVRSATASFDFTYADVAYGYVESAGPNDTAQLLVTSVCLSHCLSCLPSWGNAGYSGCARAAGASCSRPRVDREALYCQEMKKFQVCRLCFVGAGLI
jgi:hypothetical protein